MSCSIVNTDDVKRRYSGRLTREVTITVGDLFLTSVWVRAGLIEDGGTGLNAYRNVKRI